MTTSELWQFASLSGETFTRNIRGYTIHQPDQLFGALDFVFGECERAMVDVRSGASNNERLS